MANKHTPSPVPAEWFRLLVETVQDCAIVLLDPAGIVLSWNAGAALLYGYEATQVIGEHFSIFYPGSAYQPPWPQEELRLAAETGQYEQEGWRARKDTSRFWAHAVVTPLRGEDGALTGFGQVTRDMSERLRLRDLEHSSQRMNEFLAMLAHELRNPLAPIRNAVSILQLEPAPSTTVRTSRDMIDRQLSHMTRLVDDLLDAARLTSGKIRIKPELTVFNQVVAIAIEAIRPDMNARSHTFALDLPRETIRVNADPTRLAQVLQNLLANASKFTPHGGAIGLIARVNKGRLCVQVTDNGAGIAPAAMQHIFELFSQGDGLAASHQSGLGIGLSLARSLVEMHGGSISAASAGVGKGSVFSFELPGASLVKDASGDAGGPHESGKAARILVVDDNRDAADSLAEILRLLGFRVRTAYDGGTAIHAARQEMPTVLFLDIGMPGMEGPAVLRAIRQLPGGAAVLACAVSGFGAEDNKAGRAEFGSFDARLQKPVELGDLRALLAQTKTLP